VELEFVANDHTSNQARNGCVFFDSVIETDWEQFVNFDPDWQAEDKLTAPPDEQGFTWDGSSLFSMWQDLPEVEPTIISRQHTGPHEEVRGIVKGIGNSSNFPSSVFSPPQAFAPHCRGASFTLNSRSLDPITPTLINKSHVLDATPPPVSGECSASTVGSYSQSDISTPPTNRVDTVPLERHSIYRCAICKRSGYYTREARE
jgi:hypothetical protein